MYIYKHECRASIQPLAVITAIYLLHMRQYARMCTCLNGGKLPKVLQLYTHITMCEWLGLKALQGNTKWLIKLYSLETRITL